jgi:hypothetical protein
MSIADTRLRIFTFPQGWDGAKIVLRVLVAPFGNPLQPLDPGVKPFAQAQLALAAHLIPNLDRLPSPADVTERVVLGVNTPPNIEQVYTELAAQFNVDPTAPSAYVPPAKTRFLKMLMPSYLEASGFARPRTEFAVTDNRYICALADGPRPVKRPPKPPAPPKWDAVLAMALRQPVLAEQLGLIYVTSVKPPDASFYENGGWLYVTLDTAGDFAAAAAPDFLKLYAARIPALQEAVPAPVFAPVLFPVAPVPPAGSFDEILREADIYSDGFARLVHSFQPDRADYLNLSQQNEHRMRPYDEVGLKLGWDDEQIVIWLNRQLTDDPRNGSPIARDTPLGVRGFRVDVREAGPGPWASLVRMQGPIQVGALALGIFDGEMAIELAPSQLQGNRDGEYWLSPYFTQWTGSSLIAADATAFKVANTALGPRVLNPVGERSVPLRYGQSYEFRVRLTDLTGGGPGTGAENEPPSGVATCRFRRFVPPGLPSIAEPVDNPDGTRTISIGRPMLGYPALVYTPLATAEARLLADAALAAAEGRLAGFPDPDVSRIRIDVTVASLEFDPENDSEPEPRRLLYSTFRQFDDDPEQALDLTIEFEDVNDLTAFPLPAAAGPIKLPTSRTIDLTFTPVARQDPGMPSTLSDPAAATIISPIALDKDDPKLVYFGKHAARVGTRRIVTERRESANESGLFGEVPGVPFQGIFLQPSPAHDAHLNAKNATAGTRDQAPESAIQRLARQLRLENRDLTLSGEAGRRLVFGASAAVRHVLSPDHSTITFAVETEITAQWLMAVPLRLARDWTWDALTDEGLQVFRSINSGARELAGIISPRKTLNTTAVRRGVALDRSTTDLFFFDAIDPKPAPGEFPSEIKVTYTVVPQFRQAPQLPAPEWTDTVRLPMAAPPTQVPQIVSAGIALSPYERDEKYSKTEPRRRVLWIEFAEPVANPRDAYFARVAMHSADPLLIRGEPARPPGPLEPPLNIDPEPIRSIIPDQPEDSSGLDAMQRLTPAEGDGPIRHFLLPLPKTLSEASPELFGFFVYEFCVGHAKGWSTARARFALPQRLTGVQHPAPVLTCSVSRSAEYIRVSAPFATPVADGQILQAEPPTSDLWALLYVQVRLADASDWRNILISRTRLTYPASFGQLYLPSRSGSEPHGFGYCDQDEIEACLEALGLPYNSPLSVLAVELLPEPESPFMDPLGKDLGQVRVLRTSPLTPVPAICLDV